MAIFNSYVSLPEGINHNQSSFFCFQFILQGIGEQVAFDVIFHFLLPGLRSPPPSSLHWTSLHQLLPCVCLKHVIAGAVGVHTQPLAQVWLRVTLSAKTKILEHQRFIIWICRFLLHFKQLLSFFIFPLSLCNIFEQLSCAICFFSISSWILFLGFSLSRAFLSSKETPSSAVAMWSTRSESVNHFLLLRVCLLDVAFMFAFATVRNRPQPSATVRNRSREGRVAVPTVSSAKRVTFGCFQRRVASFRVAGVAL